VLIAEDNEESAELLSFLVEDMGWRVVAAVTNGVAAVEQVRTLRPDLVIMDLAMPQLNGVEATRRIQETCPTPVVALTAYEEPHWLRQASRAGVGAYLVKPVRAKDLERAAAVALARFDDMLQLRRMIAEITRAEQERRELEERVKESQKLKSLSVLAGGIAHDFNNLLVGVLGNVELARLELPADSPIHKYLQGIEVSGQRAAHLSKQMLAFSGGGSFVVTHENLSQLVQSQTAALSSSIPEQVTLQLELADDLLPVLVDAMQLRQLLVNLITNASEAIDKDRGTVTVRTSTLECSRKQLQQTYVDDNLPPGSYVCLEVSDDGVGMDENTRGRVFDPFFTTKFTGRGLGLAAALGIVRGHHGAISVRSVLGNGTTVTVLLPAAQPQPEEPAVPAPTTGHFSGDGMLLIIDDEPIVLEAGRHLLSALGFEVVTASSGREGIELYHTHAEKIRLVVLDLAMPVMSGEQVLPKLKEISSDVKVLLSSGYTQTEARTRFAGAGLVGFLQKPFTLESLKRALHQALK